MEASVTGKHIVIVARELRTSTGRYVERLLNYLQEIDHANDYTILLKPEDVDGWTPINPRFEAVACPHEEYSLDEQIGLLKQLQRLNPDLVHFSMVQQPVLYRGLVVTTMQDLTTARFRNPAKNVFVFWFKQQVYKWVNKYVAKKSAHIITPTQFVKEDVASYCHIPLSKITPTLESADLLPEDEAPVPGLEDKRFIMYVGRPTPHKNLDRLITAFTQLQKQHPDLILVLAGKKDSNYQLHENRINRDGITNVLFTGFVSDAQLRWLYEHTSAYCFPSLSEGFGLPGLEAMLHGSVVASSNATCLPEVYGDAAHYFDPSDPNDMARAINDLLTDATLQKHYRLIGPVQAKKYSWRRMAEQTYDVYMTVLSS